MTRSILFALALFSLVSCRGILDREPIAILDAGSYFQTEEDAVQAVNAAYQPLLFSNGNNNFYWAFAQITSDEAITGGDGSRPGLTELDFFSYTPRTQEFNDFWKLEYTGIARCNLVLDNIGKIAMSETLRERIRGEALFLRAFYYFQLVQVFGDVPLYNRVVSPEELRIPRASRSQVFEQIREDCALAAAWLPVSYPSDQTGRATRGSAIGLLAKTWLYEGQWDKVLEETARLKALGVYGLMPDFQDNFRKSTQNNMESVWEIQHANLELGVGNSLNQWWASRKFEGYGFAEVTQELLDLYEPGDPRRRFTIALNNEDYFGVVYKNSFSSTRYGIRKYLQPMAEVTQKADGDINYTAIRYADVLLWEAEALNELGRTQEAQTPLEAVRARARAQSADPANTLPPVTTTDQELMRQAIRKERQRELAFEMHRFFDAVRWGIAAQEFPGFEAGKHEVFPIPQIEIDLNPQLQQNPNY